MGCDVAQCLVVAIIWGRAVCAGSTTLLQLARASELYRSPEVVLDSSPMPTGFPLGVGSGEHNRVRNRARPTPCLSAPRFSVFR